MAKIVLDDTNMADDEIVVMQVLLSGTKQAVIQRQIDLLFEPRTTTVPKGGQSSYPRGAENLDQTQLLRTS